jgi:hypothetical protein
VSTADTDRVIEAVWRIESSRLICRPGAYRPRRRRGRRVGAGPARHRKGGGQSGRRANGHPEARDHFRRNVLLEHPTRSKLLRAMSEKPPWKMPHRTALG